MNYFSGVDIFQTSKELVEEKFIMLFSEGLLTLDNRCQISVHHFGDDVDVFEILTRLREDNSFNIDNVLMLKKLQKS